MSVDSRGWHIALLADALMNPNPQVPTSDVLTILGASNYGVLQLPPTGGGHGLLLSVIADQVSEFAHHGYAVVAVGLKGEIESGLHWRRLTSLLRQRSTAAPPRHLIAADAKLDDEERKLASFLSRHDIPEDEKGRWRV